jgi:hypothetical protein
MGKDLKEERALSIGAPETLIWSDGTVEELALLRLLVAYDA